MLHAVIMAGGAGTRFWPESRADRPKQLLPITGERTMIQATVDRLGDLVPPENVVVATTERLAGAIHTQLSALERDRVLVEPCKRDTAPAVGLAAFRVIRDDPDAVMALMPSDHVISPDSAFQQAIAFARDLVAEKPQRLITFGIKPTYPAESFGYIERGEALSSGGAGAGPAAYDVAQFKEKPSVDIAQQYLDSGRFYWNGGIFVWKAATILELLAKFEPEMFAHLQAIADAADTPDFVDVLGREFAAIDGKSIDYAVMERAEEVVVVEAPFHWDDVGSWRALERLRTPDGDGNIVDAARFIGMETRDSIIRAGDDRHVVVTVGVDNLIVIHTPDATLIASKEHEEKIRGVVKELGAKGWSEYL